MVTTCYATSPVVGDEFEYYVDNAGQLAFVPDTDTTPLVCSTRRPYRVEITEVTDENNDGRADLADVEYLMRNRKNTMTLLNGDGDFRSKEVTELRNEADFIITNPPFSLFREFLAWIVEAGKKFAVIGNMNAITYKEVFPLIKDNKVWLGATGNGNDMVFGVPEGAKVDEKDRAKAARLGYVGNYTRLGNSCWFTSIEHGRRHEPLSLMSMADNLRFSKHKELKGKAAYDRYDNYDAIEVPFTDAIPSDYEGVMGVPISFLIKYCPEQFKILGITKTWYGIASKIYPEQIQIDHHGKESKVTKLNDGAVLLHSKVPQNETYYIVDGKYYTQVYARVLIRHIRL